jgi:hypothetical protein
MWRSNDEASDMTLNFWISVFAGIASYWCGYFLIKWSIALFLDNGWVVQSEEVNNPPMIEFAFICIIVILCSIQHLFNWVWRRIWKFFGVDNLGKIFGVMVSTGLIFFTGFITYLIGYWFIIWGAEIMNNVTYISKYF